MSNLDWQEKIQIYYEVARHFAEEDIVCWFEDHNEEIPSREELDEIVDEYQSRQENDEDWYYIREDVIYDWHQGYL